MVYTCTHAWSHCRGKTFLYMYKRKILVYPKQYQKKKKKTVHALLLQLCSLLKGNLFA